MKITGIFFCAPFLLFLACNVGHAEGSEKMTPLLLAIQDAPVPFMGSDGRVHLVYELGMTNFSSGDIAVEKVEVVGDGAILQTLDTAAVAGAPAARGSCANPPGTLARSTRALLFLNVTLAAGAKVPTELSHRITMRASAAPPGQQEFNESGGTTSVDKQALGGD